MSISMKPPALPDIPSSILEKWNIRRWYRAAPTRLLFLAEAKTGGMQKIIEIIPDRYFHRKQWDILTELSDRTLLLPDQITSRDGVRILTFPCLPTLQKLVLQNGISVSLILQMIEDISRSLDTLHQAGLLHMDISPGNIYYTNDGVFVLGDFSETCFLSSPPYPIQKQTLSPLPPECRTHPPDVRSEQYSLGILFYLLCHDGCPPNDRFQGNIPNDLSLFQSVPETEAILRPILSKMLAEEPSCRYPSLNALRSDLTEAQTRIPADAPYRLRISDTSHAFYQAATAPLPRTTRSNGVSFPPFKIRRPTLCIGLLCLLVALAGFFRQNISHSNSAGTTPAAAVSNAYADDAVSNEQPNAADAATFAAIQDSAIPDSDASEASASILDIGSQQYDSLASVLPERSAAGNIRILLAENNQLTDLSELSALPRLQEAYLSGNLCRDTSGLPELPELETLVLSDNLCTNLTGLAQLTGLTFLDLSGNAALTDITSLSALTHLQTLLLTDTAVTQDAVQQLQTALPQCEIVYSRKESSS